MLNSRQKLAALALGLSVAALVLRLRGQMVCPLLVRPRARQEVSV